MQTAMHNNVELRKFRPENKSLQKAKPLKISCDLFSGFLFKPVVKNMKVNTTIGAQEGTRTPTKLLAST
jgi:hypothetical protein